MADTVPDIGDTFTVTREYRYRTWQWRPFPWYREHVITDVHKYRVSSWLRRRRPPPVPDDEMSRLVSEMLVEIRRKDPSLAPRGTGPDSVPLEFCLREQAEYVGGSGVAGTIQRVRDITVDGRVSWSEQQLADERQRAISLAGEPLW